MQHLRKFRFGLQLVSLLTLFMFFLSPCFAAIINSARIYPTNKVTIFNGEQKVGVYTQEAPLPEGYTLETDGKCAVKMDEIYMVAEDKSLFSIDGNGNQRNLFITIGTLYFRMSEIKQPINFVTPEGNITAQTLILSSSSENKAIIGYVKATDRGSELGIVEGGSMVVLTTDGQMTVSPGSKIMLSQADMDIGAPEGGEPAGEETEKPTAAQNEPQEPTIEKPAMTKGTKIAMGAIGAGAVAGALFFMGGSGGGGSSGGKDQDISPFNIQ